MRVVVALLEKCTFGHFSFESNHITDRFYGIVNQTNGKKLPHYFIDFAFFNSVWHEIHNESILRYHFIGFPPFAVLLVLATCLFNDNRFHKAIKIHVNMFLSFFFAFSVCIPSKYIIGMLYIGVRPLYHRYLESSGHYIFGTDSAAQQKKKCFKRFLRYFKYSKHFDCGNNECCMINDDAVCLCWCGSLQSLHWMELSWRCIHRNTIDVVESMLYFKRKLNADTNNKIKKTHKYERTAFYTNMKMLQHIGMQVNK